jgi:hypothetical protein
MANSGLGIQLGGGVVDQLGTPNEREVLPQLVNNAGEAIQVAHLPYRGLRERRRSGGADP